MKAVNIGTTLKQLEGNATKRYYSFTSLTETSSLDIVFEALIEVHEYISKRLAELGALNTLTQNFHQREGYLKVF